MSNFRTIDFLLNFLNNLNLDLVCLVDTKSNADRIHHFYNRLTDRWEWDVIPLNGYSRGIVVLWKRLVVIVTLVAVSRSAFHLIISNSDDSWILTTVYNSHVLSDHRWLWFSLFGISLLNSPCLLTDDFNAISNMTEYRGGSFKNYSSKLNLFSSFISNNNLIDLGFVGPCFTWCNNQDVLARRWARLDRFLANTSWILKYNFYLNLHFAHIIFYYSPFF